MPPTIPLMQIGHLEQDQESLASLLTWHLVGGRFQVIKAPAVSLQLYCTWTRTTAPSPYLSSALPN